MFSWFHRQEGPIVVAHRGLSAAAPENTLAAFELAIEQGADAIELDVRCTADGEVVVMHDGTLDRTTDGHGRVRRASSTEIRGLSAGEWFDRRFAHEKVPLLREVFELVDHRCGVNIEVKEPPRRAGCDIIEQCIRVIRGSHARQIVLISSFHHAYVRRVKQLEPHIAGGVLYHPVRNFRTPPARLAASACAEYFFCAKSALRRRMVSNAHRRGIRTGVYTVNHIKALHRVLRDGIDLIFTDDPALMKQEILKYHNNGEQGVA